MVNPVVRALLEGLFDYAGLYPPASLTMNAAVREYRRLGDGSASWMVGPFVVDVPRVHDYVRLLQAVGRPPRHDAGISLLAGIRSSLHDDVRVISESAGLATIAQIETAATNAQFDSSPGSTIEEVRRTCATITRGRVFVECAADSDEAGVMAPAVAHNNATHNDRRMALKIRCGSPSPVDVPPARLVASFLVQCARHDVPFKATAGLHHPVRAFHSGFGPDGGTMHGFLNVLLAAALARRGASETDTEALLAEQDPTAFQLDGQSVRWQRLAFSVDEATRAREEFFLSVGTCSVAEPVADLEAMHWLPR